MGTTKPDKPSSDFPLFARGYWAKKIKGKQKSFGKWDDPQGALSNYYDFIGEAQIDPLVEKLPGSQDWRKKIPRNVPSEFPLTAAAPGR